MQQKPLWQENVADGVGSNRVDSLDIPRPQPAKAGLTGSPESISVDSVDSGGLSFGTVVKMGLSRAGPLKAAAIDVGMDQTQMGRELERGDLRLKRLDQLSPDAKAAVAEAMQDAYGQAADPRARARRLIRQVRAQLDELAELIA